MKNKPGDDMTEERDFRGEFKNTPTGHEDEWEGLTKPDNVFPAYSGPHDESTWEIRFGWLEEILDEVDSLRAMNKKLWKELRNFSPLHRDDDDMEERDWEKEIQKEITFSNQIPVKLGNDMKDEIKRLNKELDEYDDEVDRLAEITKSLGKELEQVKKEKMVIKEGYDGMHEQLIETEKTKDFHVETIRQIKIELAKHNLRSG